MLCKILTIYLNILKLLSMSGREGLSNSQERAQSEAKAI